MYKPKAINLIPARFDSATCLTIALGWAEVSALKTRNIVVSSVDYFDCQPEFVNAFPALVDVVTKTAVEGNSIGTNLPLLQLSNPATTQTGPTLGIDDHLLHYN